MKYLGRLLRRAAIAVTVFSLFTAAYVFGESPSVRNFGTVESSVLYRGAQPSGNDLHSLAQFGIKTVIDLRHGGSVETERKQAEALGLNFVSIPLSSVMAPSDEQVKHILAVIDASPKPIFIHCHHGSDRTGVAVAVFRMTHDHWTNSKAMQEAKIYHINWLQFRMKHYIEHYRP
jgi:protein tyrosine/serine phosphatase